MWSVPSYVSAVIAKVAGRNSDGTLSAGGVARLGAARCGTLRQCTAQAGHCSWVHTQLTIYLHSVVDCEVGYVSRSSLQVFLQEHLPHAVRAQLKRVRPLDRPVFGKMALGEEGNEYTKYDLQGHSHRSNTKQISGTHLRAVNHALVTNHCKGRTSSEAARGNPSFHSTYLKWCTQQ